MSLITYKQNVLIGNKFGSANLKFAGNVFIDVAAFID